MFPGRKILSDNSEIYNEFLKAFIKSADFHEKPLLELSFKGLTKEQSSGQNADSTFFIYAHDYLCAMRGGTLNSNGQKIPSGTKELDKLYICTKTFDGLTIILDHLNTDKAIEGLKIKNNVTGPGKGVNTSLLEFSVAHFLGAYIFGNLCFWEIQVKDVKYINREISEIGDPSGTVETGFNADRTETTS